MFYSAMKISYEDNFIPTKIWYGFKFIIWEESLICVALKVWNSRCVPSFTPEISFLHICTFMAWARCLGPDLLAHPCRSVQTNVPADLDWYCLPMPWRRMYGGKCYLDSIIVYEIPFTVEKNVMTGNDFKCVNTMWYL